MIAAENAKKFSLKKFFSKAEDAMEFSLWKNRTSYKAFLKACFFPLRLFTFFYNSSQQHVMLCQRVIIVINGKIL